ncbi:MAG: hypothetical protein N3A69_12850, partial [Leptospiraceae bacterium]|nr:hypothetical protein [Leptospiraceae bacterium]
MSFFHVDFNKSAKHFLTGFLLLIPLYLSVKIFINISKSPLTGWSLSEILITYQGGFVRRGLLG